jgi:hypothetical protein
MAARPQQITMKYLGPVLKQLDLDGQFRAEWGRLEEERRAAGKMYHPRMYSYWMAVRAFIEREPRIVVLLREKFGVMHWRAQNTNYKPEGYVAENDPLAESASVGDLDQPALPRFVNADEFQGAPFDRDGAREWVIQHLSQPSVVPSMCPNPGTWALFFQAREDPRWFMEKLYQPGKTVKASSGGADEDDAFREKELADASVEECLQVYEGYAGKGAGE